ncbi:MAG: kynureninase [Bacteroidetes bacterium]|nr:kynureninase [Bacteroidota bacterium]
MTFENTLAFAQKLDSEDKLAKYRNEFHFPNSMHTGKPALYFTGNSLGLMPKRVKEYMDIELDDWAKFGVEGHFHARNPWFHYHKFFTEKAARLVGAKPAEVVMMNNLTVNLHLMMVSFYRPTEKRFKIMIEGCAFPSDQYAVASQARLHGFNPEKAVIELVPREGEHTLRPEDILAKIEEHGDELALVMLGGVNYYTGQAFDMKAITEAGHVVGAFVGFDLAHAAGNLLLKLHDWGVDFAVWCTYKYLNSGPGSVSGAFVHERHSGLKDIPRFEGWWGYDEENRFKMTKGFVPMEGAPAWQLSNAPVFNMVAHKASLDLFDEVGMQALRAKSDLLTAYMEFLINGLVDENGNKRFEIITPADQKQRGAQLSILSLSEGKKLFDFITEKGIIADWRNPNVIRVAPVPMYNSFKDVYEFVQILDSY